MHHEKVQCSCVHARMERPAKTKAKGTFYMIDMKRAEF